MIPDRSLPVPTEPPPATWNQFSTRLTNWVLSVFQSFQSQVLWQIVVTQVTPDAPVAGQWYGTIPYTLAASESTVADPNGIPQAELVGAFGAMGQVLFFNSGPLGSGEWHIETVKVAGIDTVSIVLGGPAVPTRVWFAFLVAR